MNKQEIENAIELLRDNIKYLEGRFNELLDIRMDDADVEVFKLAIHALEKQIPKPIVGIKAQLQNRYCPSCNEWMFFDKYGQAKYCPTCGQAIDWGNEDE